MRWHTYCIYGLHRKKGKNMKKILFLIALVLSPVIFSACSQKCEVEPIVEENHKLIVPPNFGAMPK